jgi:hypothetical protein
MSTTPGIELLLELQKQSLASAARRPHHARPAAHGAGRSAATTADHLSLAVMPARRLVQGLRAAISPSSAPRSVACCA